MVALLLARCAGAIAGILPPVVAMIADDVRRGVLHFGSDVGDGRVADRARSGEVNVAVAISAEQVAGRRPGAVDAQCRWAHGDDVVAVLGEQVMQQSVGVVGAGFPAPVLGGHFAAAIASAAFMVSMRTQRVPLRASK